MKKILFVSLLMLTSACTSDEQAPISDRGKQFYGHSGGSYTAPTTSESENFEVNPGPREVSQQASSAPAPEVGVSELPPPTPIQSSNIAPLDAPAPQSAASSSTLAPGPTNLVDEPVSDREGISLIWPVTGGKVTAHFKGVANDGINISISDGEPIVAAASGMVVYSGNDLQDYGNMVIVRHDNGWMTAYANASRIVAKKGAYVKQGDIIAYVGSSGNVKTPQVHFALRKGKTPVDPEKYLPKS